MRLAAVEAVELIDQLEDRRGHDDHVGDILAGRIIGREAAQG